VRVKREKKKTVPFSTKKELCQWGKLKIFQINSQGGKKCRRGEEKVDDKWSRKVGHNRLDWGGKVQDLLVSGEGKKIDLLWR